MFKFPKILLLFVGLHVFLSLFLLFPANSVNAEEKNKIEFKPQVEIPDLKKDLLKFDGSTKAIGEYIKGIYNYAIGIVAIFATIIMMLGGFSWIMAGGNAEGISEAKAWISAALSGLVLALASYTILSFVSPNLVNLKTVKITPVDPIASGCCQYKDKATGKEGAVDTTNLECEKLGKISFTPNTFAKDGKCVNENELKGCCLHSDFNRQSYKCEDVENKSNCTSYTNSWACDGYDCYDTNDPTFFPDKKCNDPSEGKNGDCI